MYCSNCGNKINEKANFCSHCGSQILVNAIEQNQVEPKQEKHIGKKKREPISAGRILLGILGCIFVTIGLYFTGGAIGLIISLFFVILPFILFVSLYNALIK